MHTGEQLQNDLKQIGLTKGDMVYVHASLRAVGAIDGGADTLIDAILAVLGPDGTLAVPTHTLSYPGFGQPPFTPGLRTIVDIGTFPELVRQRPGILRSGHASHATAAIGKHAKTLTENHDPCVAVGVGAPLHKLWQMNGKILLLGVTHKTNTSIHLAESLAKVPYRFLHYDASWGTATYEQLPDGTILKHEQAEFPGCGSQFNKVQPLLEAKGNVNVGQIGNATCYLMKSQDLVAAAIALLEEDNTVFLCDNANCSCCPPRWEFMLRK